MNRKNLRPNLAAPVDRSATTKIAYSFKQDANGIVPSWQYPQYTPGYCEWCIKDCKKYHPGDAFGCVAHTCHGDCKAYFDQF